MQQSSKCCCSPKCKVRMKQFSTIKFSLTLSKLLAKTLKFRCHLLNFLHFQNFSAFWTNGHPLYTQNSVKGVGSLLSQHHNYLVKELCMCKYTSGWMVYLCGVDIACRPSYLSTKCHQRFYQNLNANLHPKHASICSVNVSQSKIFNVARIAELLRSSRRCSRVTELCSAKTAKKECFKTLMEDADDWMSDGNEFQRSDVSDLQFYKILFAVCNVTPFSQNNCYLFQCLMLSFNVFFANKANINAVW